MAGGLGVLAFVFVGVVVAAAWLSNGGSPGTEPVAQSPTACPTVPGAEPPPGCPTPPPQPSPVRSPTPARTPGPIQSPAPSQADSSGEKALRRNPLYETGRMTRVGCDVPEGVETGDVASAKRYLERVASCLERAWEPAVSEAGYDMAELRVIITTESVQSPCGATPQEGGGGLFCYPGEGSAYLYVDPGSLSETAGADRVRQRLSLFYVGVLAHEYGHYLQYLAEISQHRSAASAGSADPKEPVRRSELQADCLAGVFIGSAGGLPAGAQRELLLRMWEGTGSDPQDEPTTHGTGQHRLQWLQRGLRSQTPGKCNTWTAPHSAVR